MKATVYIETSVVSYLASRPSRDILAAAHQSITHEWWERRRALFQLYCSELVVRESKVGDSDAATRRLKYLEGMLLLDVNEDVLKLAGTFLKKTPIPKRAAEDALHIAVATVHGMDYLLTWNCSHIANAEITPLVRVVAETNGFDLPTICTPEELMGEGPDEVERPNS